MVEESEVHAPMMGGTVSIVVAHSTDERADVARVLAGGIGRMQRWAARLTRFDEDSELSRLNREADAPRSRLSPTLASVMTCAGELHDTSGGLVDIGMLEARLSVEGSGPADTASVRGRWWIEHTYGGPWVRRNGHVAFDLDGIAKGWMADRALASLARYPAAIVDADGDIACRDDIGVGWDVAVADPRDDTREVAAISVARAVGQGPIGIATSGTTRHRWSDSGSGRHHILDPSTRRPSHGDVIQATVVARSAGMAEGLAKVAVIGGGMPAPSAVLEHGHAAILCLGDGHIRTAPGTRRWLAA